MHLSFPARFALPVLALTFIAGCSGAPPLASGAPEAAPPRAADGLLSTPALQALVEAQVLRDAAPLTLGLTSEDALVRARAALALGSVQAAEAVPALLATLQDPIPGVRADAAWALGQTADSVSVPFLFLALRKEGTAAAQIELIDAIGKIGSQSDGDALLALDLSSHLQPAVALSLARLAMRQRLSTAAFGALAERLTDDDAALRQQAAYAFSRSDGWSEQIETVRRAFDSLDDGDPARGLLARGLGRLKDAADAPRLARASGDTDWRTRVLALGALGAMTSARDARGALFRALEDPVVHVRIAAAASIGGATALPPVYIDQAEAWIVSRDTSDWQAAAALLPALVRANRLEPAITWLGRQQNRFAVASGVAALALATEDEAIERLIVFAQDEDALVATAALSALGSLWRDSRSAARAERLAPVFLSGLRRFDLATTTTAAPILADSLFIPYGASNALRDAYVQIAPEAMEARIALLSAIGKSRDGGEIDFLLDIALSDAAPPLKRAAVEALNDRLVEGIDVDLTQADEVTSTVGIDWAFLARLGRHPRLLLTTNRGEITITMDTEAAPQTVQSIARTVREGKYDGVPFHRVVPAFVLQGGDYFRRDGWGGPDVPIRSEFSRLRYGTGAAGMASSGKDTEGVQFFVTHSPQPHLDGRYSVFGQVTAGMDVADLIRVGDTIRSARITADPNAR